MLLLCPQGWPQIYDPFVSPVTTTGLACLKISLYIHGPKDTDFSAVGACLSNMECSIRLIILKQWDRLPGREFPCTLGWAHTCPPWVDHFPQP